MVPLSFANQEFEIVGSSALHWPARQALLVADLHLEKASFFARQGQMLPPYDSRATLDELAALIAKTEVKSVFCLGDNYHDSGGEQRLEADAAAQLKTLTQQVGWIWITGNHDPDVSGIWGGRVVPEWVGNGVALRHEATHDPDMPELSGHYHPKIRIRVRGRNLSRRCFVVGRRHLILPAFGTLTGGMAADDPVIENIVGGPADAIVGLSEKVARFPLGFAARVPMEKLQKQLPLFTDDDQNR